MGVALGRLDVVYVFKKRMESETTAAWCYSCSGRRGCQSDCVSTAQREAEGRAMRGMSRLISIGAILQLSEHHYFL